MLGEKTTGTPNETPLDKATREQEERAWDAVQEVKIITENLIVYSGIADFFPQDSASWIELSKQLEEEKRSLLRAIDNYEKERQLYNSLVKKEGERTYTQSWSKWDSNEWTPNKIISNTYRKFYKRINI